MISDTECLFKSREKEYQETIDQIEVRPASNLLKSSSWSDVDDGSCSLGALL